MTFKAVSIAAIMLASASAAAHAGTVTLGNGITITQLANAVPGTFNDDNVGAMTGTSSAIYDGVLGSIAFAAGADTTGVTNGTTSSAAAPDQEKTNYLWGLNDGTTVYFGTSPTNTVAVTSFIIWWGSIDSVVSANRYNNILTLSNGAAIEGDDLVKAGAALGNIDGLGTQTGSPDNQWFVISDTKSFTSFTATSSKNAFEFDMATAVPEPSTWAMMALGFAGLGYAGFRQSRRAQLSALGEQEQPI